MFGFYCHRLLICFLFFFCFSCVFMCFLFIFSVFTHYFYHDDMHTCFLLSYSLSCAFKPSVCFIHGSVLSLQAAEFFFTIWITFFVLFVLIKNKYHLTHVSSFPPSCCAYKSKWGLTMPKVILWQKLHVFFKSTLEDHEKPHDYHSVKWYIYRPYIS